MAGEAVEGLSTRLRRWWYRRFRARHVTVNLPRGLVSFTFDDFPVSALHGADRLEAHGWRGTYYVATGLCGQEWHGERVCTLDEVAGLARRGHEIGNHTTTHPRCESLPVAELERQYATSRALLEPYDGNRSFAFPHGAYDHASLGFFGRRFQSCRTVDHGINRGVVDRNRLRAVSLRRDGDPAKIEHLVEDVRSRGGWLIFYTHDLRDQPSPYGIPLERFERLLENVARAGLEVATIAQANARIGGQPG